MTLYPHEQNIDKKIRENYKKLGTMLAEMKEKKYLPMKENIEQLQFNEYDNDNFKKAAKLIQTYYSELKKIETEHKIDARSSFASSYLEEINTYLFKNLPSIKDGKLGIYNKRIYAGLKVNSDNSIMELKKDVDFCIGRKVSFSIDSQKSIDIILPIIAVEVKTYFDATMFGEIKSSSRAICSASPNAKTYLLAGYKSIADEHIIAARNDSALSEIFVLRKNADSNIEWEVLREYWLEIRNAIKSIFEGNEVPEVGRLLRCSKK